MKLFAALLFIIPTIALSQNTKQVEYIQDGNFVESAFKFRPTINNFKVHYKGLFSITKEVVTNIYDKTIKDTIYKFSFGKTKIEIYRSIDKDILQSAYIDTDKISFKYDFKIGDSKAKLAKIFTRKLNDNSFKVGDLEQGQVYTFNFISDKLVFITYDGYIE